MAKKKKEIFNVDDLLKDKKQALETALKQIENQFGKGAIMKLGQTATLDIDAISTGSIGIDLALGVGGIPRGRIIEIYGPESSGKTTVALSIVAQAQKADGVAAFIDVEHALDPTYAKAIGVDVDNLLISQPNSGEQALEITEMLVRSGAIDVVVLDSVAAMTTKAEIEGEMGEAHVGLQARLMSQAMRKLTGIISKTNCAAVFINQIREKIGNTYGSAETTPGGRALKFYSSVRMDIRKMDSIKVGTDVIGAKTRCKIKKNKVAPPFKETMFDLMYGKGISYYGELIDMGIEMDVVKRSGAWFYYNEQRLGQGKENAKKFLEENPELSQEIDALIRKNAVESANEEKKPKKKDSKKEEEKKEEKTKEKKDSPKKDAYAQEIDQPQEVAPAPSLDITPDASDFT